MKASQSRFLNFLVAVILASAVVVTVGMTVLLGIATDHHIEQSKACPAEQSDPPPRWEHTLPYRP